MLNEKFSQAIGDRIKDAREARDLTQTELGLKLGASQSSVGYWESGKRGIPLDKIPALCKALRITPGYLFGAEPIDAPQRISETYKRYQTRILELEGQLRDLREGRQS